MIGLISPTCCEFLVPAITLTCIWTLSLWNTNVLYVKAYYTIKSWMIWMRKWAIRLYSAVLCFWGFWVSFFEVCFFFSKLGKERKFLIYKVAIMYFFQVRQKTLVYKIANIYFSRIRQRKSLIWKLVIMKD